LVGNATFSVDSFFFISGLLVVLLFLRVESKKKDRENDEENFNVGSKKKKGGFICSSFMQTAKLFFYRFARLTPVYLFIVFFTQISMRLV
jgi:hypothetical protein